MRKQQWLINLSYSNIIDLYFDETNNWPVLENSPDALSPIANYFKALSEVSRLQVLCCLKSGTKNVTEIMTLTGLGQANVSKQLKALANADIVSRTPVGVSVYYQINDPLIFELCELVCKRLGERLNNQSEQLKQLEEIRRYSA